MEMIKKTQAMEDKPVRLKDTMVIYTLCELQEHKSAGTYYLYKDETTEKTIQENIYSEQEENKRQKITV